MPAPIIAAIASQAVKGAAQQGVKTGVGGGSKGALGQGAGGAAGRMAEKVNSMSLESLKDELKNRGKTAKEAKNRMTSLTGINMNTSSMLRQSQVFTGIVGGFFQLIGGLMDILLMPLVPLVLPVFSILASLLPLLMFISNIIYKILKPLGDMLNKFAYAIDPSNWGDMFAAIFNFDKWKDDLTPEQKTAIEVKAGQRASVTSATTGIPIETFLSIGSEYGSIEEMVAAHYEAERLGISPTSISQFVMDLTDPYRHMSQEVINTYLNKTLDDYPDWESYVQDRPWTTEVTGLIALGQEGVDKLLEKEGKTWIDWERDLFWAYMARHEKFNEDREKQLELKVSDVKSMAGSSRLWMSEVGYGGETFESGFLAAEAAANTGSKYNYRTRQHSSSLVQTYDPTNVLQGSGATHQSLVNMGYGQSQQTFVDARTAIIDMVQRIQSGEVTMVDVFDGHTE